MLAPGLRIVRGPDWSWGNQDGGEGHVGTVCEIGKTGSTGCPEKTVVVQWDSGTRTNYRVGYMGKYDLRVIDNAQVGVKHPNIVCDGCKSMDQGISGMRYKCTVCDDFDLCYKCYHGDVHHIKHPFKRFESATSIGIDLPPRQNQRKCELSGIFMGAKVVRGYNWEWGTQDGGAGKMGRVVDIRGWDNESSRSVANVNWFSGSTNVYRLGHKGNCDIKFVEPASGGQYYPEHLPVLGQNIEPAELPAARARAAGPLPFGVGDKVQIAVTAEELKAMQQGHGGWNPRMAENLGKVGTVHRVTDKGDIRVNFENSCRWTFNPASLRKINSFAVGDVVTLITDAELVKKLQKGHGEWVEIMKESLGHLGKVLKVYSDGDLRVNLGGRVWTLNPQCVRTVPGSAAELANTMLAADHYQRREPAIQWHPPFQNHAAGDPSATPVEKLIRASQIGNLEVVQKLLESTLKGQVDAWSNGKTALQVASHQGHVPVVRYLLLAGASVNAVDKDGDTGLHYAAFGQQPEVVDVLIKAGADLNQSNRAGCTPLHIATLKQNTRCVQLLLAAGADPNSADQYGDTALHDAIGKDDALPIIELLCTAPGTDFTLRNKRGFNVLHYAALKGKKLPTITLLSYARQLVDVKKDDGFSALHLAALNGHKSVVDTLIRVGKAEVDLRNNRGQTALLLAVSQGHCDVIELLIKLKANINATDEDGDTALHILMAKRNSFKSEIIEAETPTEIRPIYQDLLPISESGERPLPFAIACYLVRQGLSVDVVNRKGQTALDFVPDAAIQNLLRSYDPAYDNNSESIAQDMDNPTLDEEEVIPSSPARNVNQKSTRQSRKMTNNEYGNSSQDSSPTHHYVNVEFLRNPNECQVCSEMTEENVTLEPCGHKPACEDCSARMKKCLVCTKYIEKRVTKDGKVVLAKSRHPSAERVKYLESKIAEIEESVICTICMERKRNIVFLCGHGTCHECADTLKTCHMCRKTITKKIPIY